MRQSTMVDAVWFGLQSVQFLWDLDVKDPSKLKSSEEDLLRLVARGRSLREIAIFGLLLTLSESRFLGKESEIPTHFRSRAFSNEVVCRRSEALEYLALLLDDPERKAD